MATTNYIFHFREWGQLNYLEKRRPSGADAHLREEFDRLARQHSDIGPKEAYQLATQWLAAVDVDVDKLEKENDKAVRQINVGESKTSKYYVTWQRQKRTIAEILLHEPTKELLLLRIENPVCLLRPELVITNRDELLRMTNLGSDTLNTPASKRSTPQ